MRTPKALSHSSLSLWEKDRDEFYLRYLAERRAPKLPQERCMSIGSAFDAYVKCNLYHDLRLSGHDDQFALETILEEQVEPHNRDWGREHGQYVFDCYKHSGTYDELRAVLEKARQEPRFEFSVQGQIGDRVPFTGKPDLQFIHECGVHVVHDFKVKGYTSKHGASPSKGYAICRDGYDAEKPSRSHGKSHKLYEPFDHCGVTISKFWMEQTNPEYADQLSVYGWLLGEPVGDESVVVSIDELVCRPSETDRPFIRTACHRSRVSADYQRKLLDRACQAWDAITSGHIFTDLTREENDGRCEVLEKTAQSLQTDGSPEEQWFNEVVRPQFRR